MKSKLFVLIILVMGLFYNIKILYPNTISSPLDVDITYYKFDTFGKHIKLKLAVKSYTDIFNLKVEIITPSSVYADPKNCSYVCDELKIGQLVEFDTEIKIDHNTDLKIKIVVFGQGVHSNKIGLTKYLYFYWRNNNFEIKTSDEFERDKTISRLHKHGYSEPILFNCLNSTTKIYPQTSNSLSTDSLTIKGRIFYTDRDRKLTPFVYGLVELMCKQESSLKIIQQTCTDFLGQYRMSFTIDSSLIGRDAYIRISTKGLEGQPEGSTGIVEVLDEIFKEPYYAVSEPFTIHADLSGTMSIDVSIGESVDWGACSVFQHIVHGWRLTKQQLGINLNKVVVLWPSSYSNFSDTIRVLQGDRWDRDVLLHEYGHFIDQQYNLTKTPGGSHYFDENLSNRYDKETANKLAWGEAWATFFAVAIQYIETNDSYYDDTEDINMHVNLDGPIKHPGTDCHAAVAAILWDMFDEANEPFDNLYLNIQPIWKLISTTGPITNIDHFIDLWTQHDLGYLDEINAIYSEYTCKEPLFVHSNRPKLPEKLNLQNYPNPFNSETTLEYIISEPGWVTIAIYDILGKIIKTVLNEKKEAMINHQAKWNGTDDRCIPVTSGVYYAVIKTRSEKQVCKLLLIK